MANPQPDKFIRISTEFWEALNRIALSGQARQVLGVIIRRTWGFNKKKAAIPTKDFQLYTGLTPRAVERSRQTLKVMHIITTDKIVGSQVLNYSIQKDYDKWESYPHPSEMSAPSKMTGDYRQKCVQTTVKNDGGHIVKDNRQLKDRDFKPVDSVENLPKQIKTFRKFKWDDQEIKKYFTDRNVPEVQIVEAMQLATTGKRS